MHSVSTRICTRVTVSISNDDNHYTTGTCRRSIIMGIYGRRMLGMSRGSSPAWLCWSSAQSVQCWPYGPRWTWIQTWVQSRMSEYSLNWTTRSSAIQGRQRSQSYSSPTRRWPSRTWGAFRSQVCLCWTALASVKANSKLMPSASMAGRGVIAPEIVLSLDQIDLFDTLDWVKVNFLC